MLSGYASYLDSPTLPRREHDKVGNSKFFLFLDVERFGGMNELWQNLHTSSRTALKDKRIGTFESVTSTNSAGPTSVYWVSFVVCHQSLWPRSAKQAMRHRRGGLTAHTESLFCLQFQPVWFWSNLAMSTLIKQLILYCRLLY